MNKNEYNTINNKQRDINKVISPIKKIYLSDIIKSLVKYKKVKSEMEKENRQEEKLEKKEKMIEEYIPTKLVEDVVYKNIFENKISIVIAYYNRKKQIMLTLDGFEKFYVGKYNFEVIIVDDNSVSDQRLDNIINNYSFNINLLCIDEKEKDNRINPCIAYNKGFESCTGDIIIIQNPECYHVGDIIGHILENMNEQDYYSYSCFSTNTEEITCELLNSNNILEMVNNKEFTSRNKDATSSLDWYNHPTIPNRNTGYHFCSAIYKSKLDIIGGFDKRFANGYCYDDDELLLTIKYNLRLNIQIIPPDNCFVIHQYHGRSPSFNIDKETDNHPIKKKWLHNKNLYEQMRSGHEKNNFCYPKLLHLYWDGSPMSYLSYLTVVSFNRYNKNWKIIVYTPANKSETISWKTGEQSTKYTGKCYFNKLYDITNIVFQKVCLDAIGFSSSVAEVIKSDYFRYYILEKHGGLWSDFDILYTASIEEKMNFTENTIIFCCKVVRNYYYYPIGLFLTKPKSKFFGHIIKECSKIKSFNNYQVLGAQLFRKIFNFSNDRIYNIDSSIKICNHEYYLPWAWDCLDEFLVKRVNTLPPNNIGIHWFNGADASKQFTIDLDNRLNNFNITCYLDKFINKYIDSDIQISVLLKYENREEQLLEKLNNYNNLYTNNFFEVVILVKNLKDSDNIKDITLNYNYDIKIVIIDKDTKNLYNKGIYECKYNKILIEHIVYIHNINILNTYKNIIKNNDIVCLRNPIDNNKISYNFLNIIKEYKRLDCIIINKDIINDVNLNLLNNNILSNSGLKYEIIDTNNIKYNFINIPKIVHFYWDGSKACYMTNLAFKTCVFHNPNWQINLYMPTIPYIKKIVWEKDEATPPHSIKYNDYDYFNLKELKFLGINIINIDYWDLDLDMNYNEVLKSDIFRWKILSEKGGVWSDTDILFVDSMEKTNFEHFKCDFNSVDTVVSQYSRDIINNKTIDFYYIGFLMSAGKNNKFYNIMYNQAVKNINPKSYQGVGGDLIMKKFGVYDKIYDKIDKYCNLEFKSVYYYWWGQLKEMYLIESNNNIFDTTYVNNDSIIGFHWFRGVHLAKIYTLFLNHEKKIQNCNFNGILGKFTDYYKNIFNDFINNTTEHKISIVMSYINRIKQLEVTLKTISKTKHENYEVIIVNDSTEDLNHVIGLCKNIKIIDNSEKNYINPCNSYNRGFEETTGDIVLIQNPECCHIGDILTVINCTLKKNDYLVFNSYYFDNYDKNKYLRKLLDTDTDDTDTFWNINKLSNIINYLNNISETSILPKYMKGWCSHYNYNKNYYHFCSAMYKKDLDKIGGFSKKYKDGICFDDDEFVRKIKFFNMNLNYFNIANNSISYPTLIEFTAYVIHQHHDRFSYDDPNIQEKWTKNKNIFVKENEIYFIKYIETKYLNKNILNNDFTFKNLDINRKNLKIETINNDNFIMFDVIVDEFIIKYQANGDKMKFECDIYKLLNNSIFELNIHYIYSDVNNHNVIKLFNGDKIVKIHSENNIYTYIGKLDIKNIKLVNIQTGQLKNIECVLNEINYSLHTKYIENDVISFI